MKNILIADWRESWKWLSVQISTLLIIWASLPEAQQSAILSLVGLDQNKLVGLMGVAIIIGRLVAQNRQPAPALHHPEAVHLGRRIAVQDRHRAVGALAPVAGIGVVDGHLQLAPTLLHRAHLPVGLGADVAAGRGPVRLSSGAGGLERDARRIAELGDRHLVQLAAQ